MGYGQQVEDRIGRSAHGDIEPHGIQESIFTANAAWQYRIVPFEIIFSGILYDLSGSQTEQVQPESMCRQDGTVARQGQSDCLIQAIHGIGSEHP
jgi:hypothetical protein